MPLEDLTDLGFTVSRTEKAESIIPGVYVSGFGRSWNLITADAYDADGNLLPPPDEEEVVAEARNHKTLYDKMTQAMTALADNFNNWPSMTAQQKDSANRQAQRALANLIRQARGDLTSGGV